MTELAKFRPCQVRFQSAPFDFERASLVLLARCKKPRPIPIAVVIKSEWWTYFPSGDIHHAHHGFACGYCTFNEQAVTAMKLQQEALVDRVDILDFDMHCGDGTADLIRVHALDWIEHRTPGREFHHRTDLGRLAQDYFDRLSEALAISRKRDLVIFHANVDPHVTNPLGGLLTTDDLQRRDRMVFQAREGRTVVWCLAGGYQTDARGSMEPVLCMHRNTVNACLDTEGFKR